MSNFCLVMKDNLDQFDTDYTRTREVDTDYTWTREVNMGSFEYLVCFSDFFSRMIYRCVQGA